MSGMVPEPPAPTPPEPPAPEPPAPEPPEPPAPEPEPQTFDAAYVAKLRDENAKWRTQLRETQEKEKELAAKLKEKEDADLSDQERTAKQLAEVQAESQEASRQLALRDAMIRESLLEADAVKASVHPDLNIQDPDAAFRLMDRSLIEWDEDTGRATNLPEVLKSLIEARPYLVGTGEPGKVIPPVDPTNPKREPPATVPTRAQLSEMTQDQIMELWESGSLPKALAEGAIK
jgi:hypothetical protein